MCLNHEKNVFRTMAEFFMDDENRQETENKL